MFNKSSHPMILAGVELLRFGLEGEVLRLLKTTEVPFATILSSKSVLPEFHPQFVGIYQGGWSKEMVRKQVEDSDCLMSLGVRITDLDIGLFSMNLDNRRMMTVGGDRMILLPETGDAFCAAPEFHIEEAENFIVQDYYCSIGYCIPAALGVALARPGKRPVVLSGDGAFQMTPQEVSILIRERCSAVIVIINNDGYLLERHFHRDGTTWECVQTVAAEIITSCGLVFSYLLNEAIKRER